MTVLRIGLIPIAGADDRSDQLAEAIGRALDATVLVHRAADYRGVVSALEQGAVQVAWVPPLIAARAVAAGAIQPVAIAVRNGSTSYHSALITRKESGIVTIADLHDASAAWVDRESAAGYAAIRMALRAAGISLVDAFKREVFARSHAEVARLVASGQFDVGATFLNYAPDRTRLARAGWMGVSDIPDDAMRIVLEAGPIPSDFFAVHKTLPRRLVEGLQTAIVDGRPSTPNRLARKLLGADGFMRPTSEHVAMLEHLVQTLEPPRPSVSPRR